MPTKSAGLPYDLNRARFVGLEAEKTGRLDAHTVPPLLSQLVLPRVNPTQLHSETERTERFWCFFRVSQLTFIASQLVRGR
jgi:hypothetical protein